MYTQKRKMGDNAVVVIHFSCFQLLQQKLVLWILQDLMHLQP